jgi:hypothetical protein
VKRIDAQTQVRAGHRGYQGGGRLQIIAEGAGGLKLECRAGAALSGFLGLKGVV